MAEIVLKYRPEISNRTFSLYKEVKVSMSDGRSVTIPKGFTTDLSSIPSWLWSFLKPLDKALLADLLHDYLYEQKLTEIKHFGESTYKARKFADDERLKMRKKLAPKSKFKNYLTHYVVRLIGGFFYSKQIQIPV